MDRPRRSTVGRDKPRAAPSGSVLLLRGSTQGSRSRRTWLAALLVSVAGCAEQELDLADFRRFEARRVPVSSPGGACPDTVPPVTTVLEADVPGSPRSGGLRPALLLRGTGLRPRSAVQDAADPSCGAGVRVAGRCMEEVRLVNRRLSEEEVALVRQVFSRVPVFSEHDPTCDVAELVICESRTYHWDDRDFAGAVCGRGIGNAAIDAMLDGLRAKSRWESAATP